MSRERVRVSALPRLLSSVNGRVPTSIERPPPRPHNFCIGPCAFTGSIASTGRRPDKGSSARTRASVPRSRSRPPIPGYMAPCSVCPCHKLDLSTAVGERMGHPSGKVERVCPGNRVATTGYLHCGGRLSLAIGITFLLKKTMNRSI